MSNFCISSWAVRLLSLLMYFLVSVLKIQTNVNYCTPEYSSKPVDLESLSTLVERGPNFKGGSIQAVNGCYCLSYLS